MLGLSGFFFVSLLQQSASVFFEGAFSKLTFFQKIWGKTLDKISSICYNIFQKHANAKW